MIERLADDIAPIVRMIFQQSLGSSQVPDDWKKENIAAVFKKGDGSMASKYGSVSLTCASCKVLENIVFRSIMDHVDLHKIPVHFQQGVVVVVVCGRLTIPSFSWALTSLPGAEFSCSRARVQRRGLCVVSCFVLCVWWPRVREVAPLDDSTAPRPCLVEGRQTTLCMCALRYPSIDPVRLFTLVIWTGSGPLDLATSLVAATIGPAPIIWCYCA